MSATPSGDLIESFLGHALVGESHQAVRFALDLLDAGIPEEAVITDLLAPAQRQVGERWHQNTLSVADEHLATGAAESTLHALGDATAAGGTGLVVVACAEGDWHAIAAHMLSEQLRSRGVNVAFLGASTPTDQVARFVERYRPDAIAVSCNLPLFFTGVARLADAVHLLGVPVLAGGRALQGGPEKSLLLGADGWAQNIDDATAVLADWRQRPPQVRAEPTRLDRDAVTLELRASELATAAYAGLAQRFPAMGRYDAHQLARTREDLVFIVQFVAAAQLVGDALVLTEFLDWLAELLEVRAVPRTALTAGLEALQPLLGQVNQTSGELVDLGVRHLAA